MQDLEIYKNSYLIIGGPKVKKSEVSRLLSKELNYKLINLDREKHMFFDDFTDYDFNTYQNIKEQDEIKALNYIHNYEMKHLLHVLDNIDSPVVIDFGNTYTLIKDSKILNKIKMFKNIILLENDNDNILTPFENKLKNNKVNKIISTQKINTNNKTGNNIVKEILNNQKIKDIL